ncbi:MAG: aldo/keto reductase [Desulfobacterales bacterium]
MSKDRKELNRREFIRKGAQLAAGAAVLGAGIVDGSVPRDKQIPLTDAIPTRTFGKTGVELPALAMGGSGIVKIWGSTLSHEDNVALIRYAYKKGVRYFDTAGNYMESEPIMGEGLKGIRDKVYLATKVETTDPSQVRRAVEASLKKLQTDYLDCIQIHGTPGIEQMSVKQAMAIHAELVKLRDEGITRFVGMTAHHYFDKAYELISTGGFDQCMLAYGYFRKGMIRILDHRMLELREMCLTKAHELDMGILSMKVMGWVLGRQAKRFVPEFDPKGLRQLPAAAIRWVRHDSRIHLLCIGMSDKSDVDRNVLALTHPPALTSADRAVLASFAVKAYQHPDFKS